MAANIPSKLQLIKEQSQLGTTFQRLLFESDAYKNQGDLEKANAAFTELVLDVRPTIGLDVPKPTQGIAPPGA